MEYYVGNMKSQMIKSKANYQTDRHIQPKDYQAISHSLDWMGDPYVSVESIPDI